jgi:hypothetical protein
MVSYDDFSFLLNDARTNYFNSAKSYNFSVETKRPKTRPQMTMGPDIKWEMLKDSTDNNETLWVS